MDTSRSFLVILLGGLSLLVGYAPVETIPGRAQGSINLTPITGGRNAIISRRWNTTDIPYLIEDDGEFSEDDKGIMKEALANISAVSCLKFIEYRDDFGGRHPVNLGKGCVFPDLVIHEVLHALGFAHEHQRWDRDEYVNVNYSNIKAYAHLDYAKSDPEIFKTFGIEYDYHSLMHYSMRAWAIDPEYPTMVPKNPNVTSLGGNVLTQKDILRINTLYNCTNGA